MLIQCAAEALDQCYGIGLSRCVGQPGILDEMRGDHSVDDTRHSPHLRWHSQTETARRTVR